MSISDLNNFSTIVVGCIALYALIGLILKTTKKK